jgi:GMP synthase-like glutamine amidotransferase
MKIHYLQHVPFETPAFILEWARNKGIDCASTMLYEYPSGGVPFPAPTGGFDWLVIMGGPMNVYEEAAYPWLAEETRFIRETLDAGKTVIGLCLGAQLVAKALGGAVTRNPVKEIGWLPVTLTEAAREHPLFGFLPPHPVVFQWHGDTFSVLPDGAVLLAESAACAHEAFVWQERAFAFQFHLESTAETVRALLNNCAGEIDAGLASGQANIQSAAEILSRPGHIKRNNEWMSEFFDKLMRLRRN